MTIDKTTLGIGETALVELYALADDPIATGNNGLNSWQLSMIAGGDGTVEVDDTSIAVFAPFGADLLTTSINVPAGSIEDLFMSANMPPEDSTLGIDDYGKIAEFVITAISIGDVSYVIGDSGFGFYGTLRDYNFMNGEDDDNWLQGNFDDAESIYGLTVVPEPASLTLLSVMGLALLPRRTYGK